MKLATLLYIRNDKGEFLLMERAKNPNKGLMSPPGGKLIPEEAESPARCAVREGFEECRIKSRETDWKLRGVVTDKNFPEIGNIMMFLMEYRKNLNELPPDCSEGKFSFVHPDEFDKHRLPVTDTMFLWKNILGQNGEPFVFTLDCTNYPDIRIAEG